MGQAKKISPLTERFINEYNRLHGAGKLPPNTELAEIMGINSPSTISNILVRRQNIQSEAWEAFRIKFRISEVGGNGNGQTVDSILPGSVTLQDHIELLKKQATIAEADKDRLFNNNETLARALEKLGSVYEKIIANSDATKEQLDAIVDQLRAEHAVMMDALDRLEKNKVGTNAMQAGNLEIERKKFRAGKGKQVGAGK